MALTLPDATTSAGSAGVTLTVADLRGLATVALTAAGDTASRAGTRAAAGVDLFGTQVLGPLAGSGDWQDGGQHQALAKVRDTYHRADQIPTVLHAAAPIVRTWAAELAAAQAALARLQTQAALHGLTLTADGAVRPADGVVASVLEKITDPQDDAALALQAKARSILTEATEADQTCARRLLALLPDDGDPDSPWQRVAATVLAPLTGASIRTPQNRPVIPGGRGGNTRPGGGGGAGRGTTGRDGGLLNFFRRLVKPNGPWKAPSPGGGWVGSGKTTGDLKASAGKPIQPSKTEIKKGKVPPAEKRLTEAGHSLDKHNPSKRDGHKRFPIPKGDVQNKNKTAQEVLDSILDNPRTVEVRVSNPDSVAYGGFRYIAPDGRGVTFDQFGNLKYFGSWAYPG